MAVWNIVNRTDFRSHANIMAEHYQLERIRAEEYLKSISTYRIKDLYKEVIQIISPSKLEDSWNVYDLTDGISNFLTTEPHYTKSSSAKKVAVENDFVISRLRSYLKEMAVVPNCNYKMAFSTEYLVYRSKQSITASLLLPFSLSSYVQSILKWAQMGNEHPRFSSETFGDIFIPNCILAHSNEISAYIAEAIECQKQSQALYHQAETLLAKELQLDQLKLSNKKWYSTQYGEVLNRLRSDAEFYNPKLAQYYEHFSHIGLDMKCICDFVKVKKFNNPTYAKEGLPIITQRHLSVISPENYGDFPIADPNWCNKNTEAVLKKEDLLYYSVGAYLGKTNVWLNDDNAVFASFITLMRCKDVIDSCFLMLLLNSPFGILQSKVFQSGTSQPYIYPKDIKQFLVPDITRKRKEALFDLIHKSYSAMNQSKQLLAQAKHRVEELIEQEANKYK